VKRHSCRMRSSTAVTHPLLRLRCVTLFGAHPTIICSLIKNWYTAFPVLVKYSYYPTPYPLSASGEGNFGASLLGGWGSSDVPHLSENRYKSYLIFNNTQMGMQSAHTFNLVNEQIAFYQCKPLNADINFVKELR
jgi:hypothetical protein